MNMGLGVMEVAYRSYEHGARTEAASPIDLEANQSVLAPTCLQYLQGDFPSCS